MRKVYDHGAFRDERVYLGGYELYRERRLATGEIVLERQTLHVAGEDGRVALVETKTIDAEAPGLVPTPRLPISSATTSAPRCSSSTATRA